MKKYDDYFLTELILKSNIEFISGKYFYNQKEIKNIDKYITKLYYNATLKMPSERDIKYLKSGIINNPNAEEKEFWYRPAIIDEAMDLKEKGYFPQELPFPLEDKQLLILFIILFHPELEVFFITTGIGGSGKSTFLNIIKQLFENDVSSTPLADLSNDFMLAEALKHRLIASDEIGAGELNLPKLKTIVSKQLIQVNEKFGATYTTRAQSILFYSCNQAPKIDISDSGMLRRIVFYSRNTVIEKPDTSLKDKKFTRQQLIDIIIYCYNSVVSEFNEHDPYSWKNVFRKETNVYLVGTNSVGLYYKLIKEQNKKIKDISTPTYSSYRAFCSENGYKAFSSGKYEEILSWIKDNYCDEEDLKKEPEFQLLPF